jgi:putative membrane protein
MHAPSDFGGLAGFAVLLFVLALLAHGYLRAAARRAHWHRWRSIGFLVGLVLVGLALSPPLAAWAHHDLRGHMLQHLLLGMVAPVALALSAPLSLLLGALPAASARRLVRWLHGRVVGVLVHPLVALLLNIGGMALLYLTPLFALSQVHPALHVLVHWHFLAAGYLYAWAIAGPDPAPRRPSLFFRGGVLFVGMALHANLAKAMYAHGYPRGTGAGEVELQQAAMLMYYGGDAAELLLVIALCAIWYRRRRAGSGARSRLAPRAPAMTLAGFGGRPPA